MMEEHDRPEEYYVRDRDGGACFNAVVALWIIFFLVGFAYIILRFLIWTVERLVG